MTYLLVCPTECPLSLTKLSASPKLFSWVISFLCLCNQCLRLGCFSCVACLVYISCPTFPLPLLYCSCPTWLKCLAIRGFVDSVSCYARFARHHFHDCLTLPASSARRSVMILIHVSDGFYSCKWCFLIFKVRFFTIVSDVSYFCKWYFLQL